MPNTTTTARTIFNIVPPPEDGADGPACTGAGCDGAIAWRVPHFAQNKLVELCGNPQFGQKLAMGIEPPY